VGITKRPVDYISKVPSKKRAHGGGKTPLIPLYAPKNDVNPRLKSIEKFAIHDLLHGKNARVCA